MRRTVFGGVLAVGSAWPAPAAANVVIPFAFVSLVGSVAALVPVIMIEGLILRLSRVPQVAGKAMRLSVWANVTSTVLGLQLVAVSEVVVSATGRAGEVQSHAPGLLAVLFGITVAAETLVIARRAGLPFGPVLRPVLLANAVTYAALFVAVALIWGLGA